VKRILVLLAFTGTAVADAPYKPDAERSYKLVEDADLGGEVPAGERILDDAPAAEAIAKCASTTPPSGSALFWIEYSVKGTVTTTRVHGSGKADACLATAIKKVRILRKLVKSVAVVGRIDLADASGAFLESPRVSSAAVMVAPHAATWQLTVNRVGYTANRAQDIAASLDGVSAAVAGCAGKRGAKAEPAQALAWVAGGKAAFSSGNKVYDACVGKALGGIKLPVAESAMWMHVAIMKTAEPLAPRTNQAGLSKTDQLKNSLTTAVRSRKLDLLACTDGKPKAKLTKVGLALKGGKASVSKVSTGDTDADACVRNKLANVAISSAAAGDTLELEVTLDPE
jgi:hypothetical protein